MTPTSAFCRAQEAAQLARAASEPLENVRRIALAAAKAWNVEATWAESREKGHVSIPRLCLSGEEQHEDRMEQGGAQSGTIIDGDAAIPLYDSPS